MLGITPKRSDIKRINKVASDEMYELMGTVLAKKNKPTI